MPASASKSSPADISVFTATTAIRSSTSTTTMMTEDSSGDSFLVTGARCGHWELASISRIGERWSPSCAVALVAIAMFASACSDAATRVAYDIESGTKNLGSAEGSRGEIRHEPSRWPEGCAGSYTLQIGRGSATADGNGNFHINRD